MVVWSKMITIVIVIVSILTLYFYSTRNFKYWEQKGVKHDKPIPIFGNNFANFSMKKSMAVVAAEQYFKYPNEKIVGFYRGSVPELVIRDPEIIKRLITNDFAHFYRRGLLAHERNLEPMMRNIFFADGDLWRLLRQRMTPAFTSGKLKAMFPLIVERAEKLQARALNAAAAGRPLDARDLIARYTTDFIGACGFGLESDSLNNENSAFRKLGADIFTYTLPRAIVIVLKRLFPDVFKNFKYMGHVENDILKIVNEIQKQRNYEPSGRNDFIDLLLESKKRGLIVCESVEKINEDGTPEKVSLEFDAQLMAAQVLLFFVAGFETSSSASSFTLHQLAYHPKVQEKVQMNIDKVLNKYNNKLCYDAIKEMTYLEWAFKEGMRMFPSLGYLARNCARKYTIPDLNITIDEDVGIVIPLQALHNDPQYFDAPEEFRPERFSPEEFDENKLKYVYMPFGEGPRACIGVRLGQMQSLAGLAAILSRFTVEPAPETLRQPKVEPNSNIVQIIRGGLPLIFRERQNVPFAIE